MTLIISLEIEKKLLRKHNVSKQEVIDCFANRDGEFLIEDREEHKTDPQTHWFIAETDMGRKLRVYFVPRTNDDGGIDICLKTALNPKQHHIDTYNEKAY
ncbi:hypothetical protein MNBD_GAMMA09-387 [hydrothermal vent metagenome]|uniref:ADP-ribosyl-(Dinitrogen reductase) hydrolase n=1 Tax=hydrothermal vent metagenome TaxID=652676 RepID=A0A3B0Y116_9ZZZZ